MQTVQSSAPEETRYRLAKNSDAIRFADSLNALIAQSGKSQKDIAQDTGTRLSSLSDYTQAKAVPRMDIARRLAEYFHVSLDVLANGGASPDVSPSVGDADIAAALGVSLKTVQRIKSMSADRNWYNVVDILISSDTFLDVLGEVNHALHVAARSVALSHIDADQRLNAVCVDDYDKFTVSRNYLEGHGCPVLADVAAGTDFYLYRAADAFKSLFKQYAEQNLTTSQNPSTGKDIG